MRKPLFLPLLSVCLCLSACLCLSLDISYSSSYSAYVCPQAIVHVDVARMSGVSHCLHCRGFMNDVCNGNGAVPGDASGIWAVQSDILTLSINARYARTPLPSPETFTIFSGSYRSVLQFHHSKYRSVLQLVSSKYRSVLQSVSSVKVSLSFIVSFTSQSIAQFYSQFHQSRYRSVLVLPVN